MEWKKKTRLLAAVPVLVASGAWAATPIPADTLISGSVDAQQWQVYSLSNGAGANSITAYLTELDDDIDLYVKVGAAPTRQDYDCRSVNYSNEDDQCSARLDGSSNVYIGIWGDASRPISS